MPQRVKDKLFDKNILKGIKIVDDFEVFKKFESRKLKTSSVPGDIPPVIKKEFYVELAAPVANIFNSITISGEYPRQWIREYATPIPKENPVESEDDLRPISLTADLSKDYENFLMDWLEPYVQRKLDPGQMGGITGCSIIHYLITLFNFILEGLDINDNVPRSVVVALIDYSKGFNRISHQNLIIRLSDWGVPGWLLRILCSYLSGRTMIVRHKGVSSSEYPLPGGAGQGCLLGVLSFIVAISDAGMAVPEQPEEDPHIDDVISVWHPEAAVNEFEVRQKYIDDQVQGELLRLDQDLCPLPNDFIGPRTYHDRNGLVNKPNTRLQMRLNDIESHTKIHQMKINEKKTKIMPFNFTRKYDFIPNYSINGQDLEVVYETKLLGVKIQSNCKWSSNTKHITKKAKSKLWYLRRLKHLGASDDTLIDLFKLHVRSTLEMALPLWAGALTKSEINSIERVQKISVKLILGNRYREYNQALKDLDLENLEIRRKNICLKFAKKCLKNDRFKHWFPKRVSKNTRNKEMFIQPSGPHTKRYLTSSIPYLINILNENQIKQANK